MKKYSKKEFLKEFSNYLKNLSDEEKFVVARGLWHVWNSSKMYSEKTYGSVKTHNDIIELALIAHNECQNVK